MPVVKLKDGTSVQVPEDLTPEEEAWLTENRAPSVGKDIAKSLVSGTVEGAARAPFIFGDLLSLGARGLNKLRPGTVDPKYEKLVSDRAVEIGEDSTGLERHIPETTSGRYANAAGNAVGGSWMGFAGAPTKFFTPAATTASLPGLGSGTASVVRNALRTPAITTPLIGMAGQAGADATEGSALGALGGGLAAQLAMALASKGMTPNHPHWIREGTKGMSEADWQQAEANRQLLERSGAQSATLTDAMPETAQLRGFTRDLSNTTGASALAAKLSGRQSAGEQVLENGKLVYKNQGDVPRLLGEASEAVYPGGVNAGTVTDQAADQAAGTIKAATDSRRAAYMPILENAPPVPRQDLRSLLAQQLAAARKPSNLGTPDQAKYEAAVNALRRTPLYRVPQQNSGNLPMPVPGLAPTELVSNLQALSKNVKNLKQGIPTPGMPLDKAAGYEAYKMADDTLRQVSPDYAKAMDVYQAETVNKVNPLRQGLVGQVAALKGKPPTEGNLSSVLSRTTPQELGANLPGIVGTNPDFKRQVARVLADQNKAPVTKATAGAEGVQRARQTVIDLAPDAADTFATKTRAADTLAKLSAESGADSTARQGLGRSLVAGAAAPFYEFRRWRELSLTEKEATVLSNLLSNPTAENMKLLKRIAQERPETGEALRKLGVFGAVGATTSSQGE